MNYQFVRKNTRKVIKFIPTIPPKPTIVIILFFSCIPGKRAKEISSPPINPPIWATASIDDPIEKRREKTIIMPIMQHKVDRTFPNLSRAFQFIIK